jgi:hypothetical protein
MIVTWIYMYSADIVYICELEMIKGRSVVLMESSFTDVVPLNQYGEKIIKITICKYSRFFVMDYVNSWYKASNISNLDQFDDLKAPKSCDETKDIFKWHFPSANYFVFVSTVSSNSPIGLDLTYLMFHLMHQHNPSQKLTKIAVKYFLWIFSRTNLKWRFYGTTLVTEDCATRLPISPSSPLIIWTI